MNDSLSTLADIFSGKILAVPDYQRGYAWEEAQLRDLVEDLDTLRPSQVHYAGTVVLHAQEAEERDEAKRRHVLHHVVDGQQRLTTITILIEGLRRELLAIEGEGSPAAEDLRRSFLWMHSPRTPKLRLFGGLGKHFESHVLAERGGIVPAETHAARRLDEAKRFFADYFAEQRRARADAYLEWLEHLQIKVTEQLKFTVFPVGSAADVGVIFEVMNNRGKPLSELEKVKNYLLYLAAKLESARLAEAVNGTWASVLSVMMTAGLVGRGDEDRLLRTHWLLTQDHDEKKWDGYRSIKARFDLRSHGSDEQRVELEGAIHRYLETLEETAIALGDIDRPTRGEAFAGYAHEEELRRELALWTERLHRLGNVATFRSFLAGVRMKHREPRGYLDAVKACEQFSFLAYKVAGCRSNAGRTSFNWLGRRLYSGAETFADALLRVSGWTGGYCVAGTYDQFWRLDEGSPRDFYAWGGLRYLLYEWETHRVGHKHVRIEWKTLYDKQPKTTIEHVLPQTATDPYWTERFDEAARARLTHDLGNLSLTEDNSSYGNKPFPRKRGDAGADHRCYVRSVLVTEQDLARWSDWTPEAIEARRADIVEWAKERWPHPGAAAIDEDARAAEAEDE